MSSNNRLSNPVAVAMKLRYGRTTSIMKDRRAPRGGCHNEYREMMDEYELYVSSSNCLVDSYTSSSFGEENNAEQSE